MHSSTEGIRLLLLTLGDHQFVLHRVAAGERCDFSIELLFGVRIPHLSQQRHRPIIHLDAKGVIH